MGTKLYQHRFGRILIASLALVLSAGAARAGEAEVAAIELADQRGRTDSLGAHAGEVVVVFVVAVTSMLNTKLWEEDLREQVDGVTYLRVADVPQGSRASMDRIVARLLRVVPGDVSVMIDMDRRWADALALDTAEPNILLYTRNGLLGARYRGRWHPDSVVEVAARVRQLQALP